jgi:septum formation protein
MKVILASASARRHELLKRLIEDFSIVVSDFDEEKVHFAGSCEEYVKEISRGKASEVAARNKDGAIVIGCDTIVSFEDKVLGKPKNAEDAFEMLKRLSCSKHQVFSGITVINTKTGLTISEAVKTDVIFSHISDEEALKYIKTGEPMDKAGAYGIQGLGGVFVEEIHGCFYNVVGLPINKLKKMLGEIGVNL